MHRIITDDLLHQISAPGHRRLIQLALIPDSSTAAISTLISRMRGNVYLHKLSFAKCTGFTAQHIRELADVLPTTNIRALDLSNTKLGVDGILALADLLEKNPQIEDLSLEQIQSIDSSAPGTAEALNKLFTAMKKCKNLKRVNLRYNAFIGEIMARSTTCSLAVMLKDNDHLKTILLKSCSLTAETISDISTALFENKSLKTLDLCDPVSINKTAIDMICTMVVSQVNVLDTIHLYHSSISLDNESARRVMSALIDNRKIRRIGLGWRLTELEDLQLLDRVLSSNPSIIELEFDTIFLPKPIDMERMALLEQILSYPHLSSLIFSSVEEPLSIRTACTLLILGIHLHGLRIVIKPDPAGDISFLQLIDAYENNPSIYRLTVDLVGFPPEESNRFYGIIASLNEHRAGLHHEGVPLIQQPRLESAASSSSASNTLASTRADTPITQVSERSYSPQELIQFDLERVFIFTYWQKYSDVTESPVTDEFQDSVNQIFRQLVRDSFKKIGYDCADPNKNLAILRLLEQQLDPEFFIITPNTPLQAQNFSLKDRNRFHSIIKNRFGSIANQSHTLPVQAIKRPRT